MILHPTHEAARKAAIATLRDKGGMCRIYFTGTHYTAQWGSAFPGDSWRLVETGKALIVSNDGFIDIIFEWTPA